MPKTDTPRKPTRKEFDGLLMQMIDDNLLQVFGSSATDTIFLYFDRRNGWSKDDIPNQMEAFIAGLHDLLGIGATSLERLLLKTLCTNLKTDYDPGSNVKLATYVQQLREQFEE